MIETIDFLGVEEMNLIQPSLSTVVVSILEMSEERKRPKLVGFLDVITLQFEDNSEDCFSRNPGDWGDFPDSTEYIKFSQEKGEQPPNLDHARAIVAFVDSANKFNFPINLVVHCYGGISRSAAVASWASVKYRVPMLRDESGSENKRLMHLLFKAEEEVRKRDLMQFMKI